MSLTVSHVHAPHPEAVVAFVTSNKELPAFAPDEAKAAVARKHFSGEVGEIVEAYPSDSPLMIIVGLGKGDGPRADFRNAGFELANRLRTRKFENVHLDLSWVRLEGDALREAGESLGLALGLHVFDPMMFVGSAGKSEEGTLNVAVLQGEADSGLADGLKLAASVNFARSLVNTPPNIATPLWMADQARAVAASTTGLSLRVFEGDALITEQMTGLINVGKASENPPCMIRLEWAPAGTEAQDPVVFVGKAITYDTGGLSIKSKDGMPGMKYDKSGGCAVLGLMHAVATVLKPNKRVVALIMAAENSIAGNAYRPDDVITYRNGVTVEVTNTDAEGRLVLADGLCYACDVEHPAAIIDIATLTGGVVTALGSLNGGLFSETDALADQLLQAGKASGETLWRLPLNDDYRAMMKGECSDIINSKKGGRAHPCQGAAFLSYFVKPGVPFAHVDMAGMSESQGNEAVADGPSGYGVRLFAEFLKGSV